MENRKMEFFWEAKYAFVDFLSNLCFPNTFKRKFSLTGDGVYNLVLLPKLNKIFEIKLTQVQKLPSNPDGALTKNAIKNKVISQIANNLAEEKRIIDKGCIYVAYKQGWFGKIQVIEKRKMPE